MGEEFMLSAEDGRPRTSAWQKYVEACEAARLWQVRDELWIAAHMEDMERVRRSGLEERFRRQAVAHRDDPSWQAIHQHVEATLGTRLMDRIALEGTVAYETAFAHSLSATFFRLCTVSWHLVRRYWWEGFRAVAVPAGKSHEGIVSYRRLPLAILSLPGTLHAFTGVACANGIAAAALPKTAGRCSPMCSGHESLRCVVHGSKALDIQDRNQGHRQATRERAHCRKPGMRNCKNPAPKGRHMLAQGVSP